jgi:hypothetical protein
VPTRPSPLGTSHITGRWFRSIRRPLLSRDPEQTRGIVEFDDLSCGVTLLPEFRNLLLSLDNFIRAQKKGF